MAESKSCRFCSGEIIFRSIKGNTVPIHQRDYNCVTQQRAGQPSLCFLSKCPRCQQPVYFVRHNGGTVWFDELGKPWDKHPCFASQEPTAVPEDQTAPSFSLQRVRDVFPLKDRSGVMIACGHGRKKAETWDILGVIEIPRLKNRYCYISYVKKELVTLDGRRFRLLPHEWVGGPRYKV